MCKKQIAAALSLILAVGNASLFGNDVFLSLTKNADPFKKMPTNVSVINASQIEEIGARNAGEAVDSAVGLNRSITGTLGATSSIIFRGSRAEGTLVMIDGMPLNSLSIGSADLSTLPADNIERIEIIRGGSSALYGTSAFGGTINIITKKPVIEGHKLGVNVSAGSYSYGSFGLNFSAKKERSSGSVIASKDSCDGYRDNSEFESNEFFGKLDYALTNSSEIDFTASYYNSDQGVPGILFDPLTFQLLGPDKYDGSIEKTASTPNGKQKFLRSYAKLDYLKDFSGNNLKLSFHGLQEKMNTKDTMTLGSNDDEFTSAVSGIDAQYTPENLFTAGAEARLENYSQQDLLTRSYIIDKSRTNSSLYVLKEIELDNFLIIPGARVDSNSVFGGVFAPKISLVYFADDKIKLSANSGKSWRTPTFNELYYKDAFGSSGNPDLQPEEGITTDAGIEYSDSRINCSATLYQTVSKNLIEWEFDPVTFVSTPKNVSDARLSGAEAGFAQLISKCFSHNLNYTYLWAVNENTDTVLIYRPQNKFNYTLTYTAPCNSKCDIFAQYASPRRTGDAGTPELDAYTLLGAKISHKFASSEIWFKGENLTDIKYQTRLGYPLPGTTYSAGFRIDF